MHKRRKAYSYIRMSTAKQLHGDSLRRQTAAACDFCSKHDLDLDEEFMLQDLGVSGYSGENLTSGHLGRFIKAVEDGEIEPGSFLIIESHDRFSRTKPRRALRYFLQILNAGITIAILSEGKVFGPQDDDPYELLPAISSMIRSHQESALKSERVRAARAHSREHLDKKILTSMGPTWLQAKPDRTGFDIIPERVEVVRLMFEMAMSMGADAVATELNRGNIRNFGRGQQGWGKSSVQKILTSRSVIGEFEPCIKRDGKRIPTGKVHQNYYPPVIDPQIFYAVQQRRAAQKIVGGGRHGDKLANLFSKIARCGHCHGPMIMKNKGEKGGGRYLMCGNAARGLGCRATYWSYRSFELSFLNLVKEIDFSSVATSHIQRSAQEQKRIEVEAAKGRLTEAEQRRDRAFEILMEGSQTTYLRQRLDAADYRATQMKAELAAVEAEYDRLRADGEAVQSSGRSLLGLLREMDATGDERTFLIRSRVRKAISDVVERICVFPAGNVPTEEQEHQIRLDQLTRMKGIMGRVPLSHAKKMYRSVVFDDRPHPDKRFFVVKFKDGPLLTVKPNFIDPTAIELVQDQGADVVIRSQVKEMAPKFGLNPDRPDEFDDALRRLRRMTLESAAFDAADLEAELHRSVLREWEEFFGTQPLPRVAEGNVNYQLQSTCSGEAAWSDEEVCGE